MSLVSNWVGRPWLPYFLMVTTLAVLSCSQDRQYENYGDIRTSPGGISLIDPEEHGGGYGRTSCLVCHNLELNLHRSEGSSFSNAEQLNDTIRENGGSTFCLKCHGANGTD